jgi:hypothetical protein
MYHFDEVGEKRFFEGIYYYILALVAFNFGIITYYDLSNKKVKMIFNKSFTDSLFIKIKADNSLKKVAIGLTIVIIALFVLTYGESIFYRDKYLPKVDRLNTILIKILSFIDVILLAFIYKKNKKLSIFILITVMFFSIGTGSRTVFLSLVSFFVILFISSGNTLKNKLIFVLNMVFSILFLAYLMQLRGLEKHGTIPYLSNIANLDSNFLDSLIFNIYYSLIFGVYVTIKTMQEAIKDWHILWVSLNPMPGKLAGWYDYAKQMRLNIFAPYSLHGRIFIMGKYFTFFYFFITGLIFSDIEKRVRKYFLKGNRAIAFLLVLLMVLHIVYGFEYNLRAAFRYIYYAYFIVFMTYVFSLIWPYLIAKK